MDEFPIASIPDTPHWSENFAFACFDPRLELELFCHIGRWRRDLKLWREVVTVALPDGTVLVHRAIGNALASPQGPGGSNFQIAFDAQADTFRLHFLGAVRRISEQALFEGPLMDGPHFRLAFDIEFKGAAPRWDISRVGHKTEFMGAGHLEQIGRFRGRIDLAGEQYLIDSLGNRDHSRGPRVFDSNIRHHWLQGFLSDGLMFQMYEAEIAGREGAAYSEASVVKDGIAHPATATILDKLPFIDNRRLIKSPVRIAIHYASSSLDVTATQFVRTISIQSTSPNDMYVGRRQEDEEQNTTVIEQGVRYLTNDGVRGYGHLERLVPGKLLKDPR